MNLQNPEIMKTEKRRSAAKKTIAASNKPDGLNFDVISEASNDNKNDRFQEIVSLLDKEIFWSESTIAPKNRLDSQIKPPVNNFKARPGKIRNTYSHAPYNEMYNMADMPDFT